MKTFFYVSILLLGFWSCQKKTETRQPNNIHKVEFAYRGGGCSFIGPTLYFIMDSSLTYKYYGDKRADMPGYWETQLPQEQWDKLCWALECGSYMSIPDSTSLSTVSIVEFYIHHSGGVKHIYGNDFKNPWMGHIIGHICTSPKYLPLQYSDYIYFRCTAPEPEPNWEELNKKYELE